MKRVIIVHGWGGKPEHGWYSWLKEKLEQKGFVVSLPQLPDTDNPRIEKWVPALAAAAGPVDEDTYFVGHSLGCQTVARYLEGLGKDVKVGGVIFVAGFFDTLNREEYEKDDLETSDLWLDSPIDLEKVKSHIEKSVAYFSEDDPDVPPSNKETFETRLGSEVITLNGYGHFTGDDGINELPFVLEKILEISS